MGRKRKKEKARDKEKKGSSTDESYSSVAEGDAQRDQIVKRKVKQFTGLLQVLYTKKSQRKKGITPGVTQNKSCLQLKQGEGKKKSETRQK